MVQVSELLAVWDRACRRTISATRNVALLCALPLMLLALGATPAWAGGWVIECIDCGKYFDQMTTHALQLATGAQGRPHIAYGGDRLYYAWYDGTAWQYETVPTDDAGWAGTYAALALDEHGYPHIGYQNARFQLRYAYQDADGWHVEDIPMSEFWSGHLGDLVLGNDGNPYAVYYEQWYKSGPYLKYAYRDATGWHSQTVPTGHKGGSYGTSSLALDRRGHPQIGYYDAATGNLMYAYFPMQPNGRWECPCRGHRR